MHSWILEFYWFVCLSVVIEQFSSKYLGWKSALHTSSFGKIDQPWYSLRRLAEKLRLTTKSILVNIVIFLEHFLEFLHFFLSLSVISIVKFLKEFCQEDFALFRQFCADVISTWYLTPYTKCFCRVIKKISSKFYHGSLSNFLGDYCRHSTQTLKKLAQLFQFSIYALCNKRQE